MATPEDCGVDEKAAAKLRTLPDEVQQEILARLLEGQAAGNIHNPSGFVVSEAVKAARRFSSMVTAGPPARRHTGPPPGLETQSLDTPGEEEIAEGLASLGVDAEATALLRQLPLEAQAEILGQLRELTASGAARNPSAWTARAANNYARKRPGQEVLVATRSRPAQHRPAAPFHVVPAGLTPEVLGVDSGAAQVLRTLPPETQQQLLGELRDGLGKGSVQNPSGWIIKAAKRRGAESTPGYVPVPNPEQLGVDDRAAEMVRKLPFQAQREVLNLLAAGLAQGNVSNPSGFVVKKAMLARANGLASSRSAPY